MALTNKLSAIGDAIRGKTGKTDLLTLDQMVTEINGITTSGGSVEILPDDIEKLILFISKSALPEKYNGVFEDNLITEVGGYSFSNNTDSTNIEVMKLNNCKVVKNMGINQNNTITELYLPNIEEFEYGSMCIRALSKLEILLLGKLTEFTGYSQGNIQRLTALKHLILPNDTLTVLNTTTGTLFDTNTTNVEGIYVPRALVDTYKTATNWVQYADLFKAIEDYPDICGEVV